MHWIMWRETYARPYSEELLAAGKSVQLLRHRGGVGLGGGSGEEANEAAGFGEERWRLGLPSIDRHAIQRISNPPVLT